MHAYRTIDVFTINVKYELMFRRAVGFSLRPAPYDKAQASDVMCKRAAHPGSGVIKKERMSCLHAET